jgi:hypothetical protein
MDTQYSKSPVLPGMRGKRKIMTTYNPIKAGQQIHVMVQDGCAITINRPDGAVDVVKNPAGIHEMNPVLFARIRKATKAAGRGDVVKFENFKKPATYTVTDADAATDSSAQIERILKAGE